MSRRSFGLFRKARAKFRRRVFGGHHEEIVERGDRSARGPCVETLIQRVKDIRLNQRKRRQQQPPLHVAQRRRRGAAELFPSVRKNEGVTRVLFGQTRQQFARINRNAGWVRVNTVGCIERNAHAPKFTGWRASAGRSQAVFFQFAVERSAANAQHRSCQCPVAPSNFNGHA